MDFDEENDDIGNRIESVDESDEEEKPSVSESDHPYTRLNPDGVIAAVESTGRYSDARILALNSYENRVYQVGIEDDEPVIVKFYRPERWSREQILEEHQFTWYLYDQEIPVVPPLKIVDATNQSATESTLGRYDDFYFAVYARQGGRAPELDNLDHLHQLGQFIGRIHAAGEGFKFQHRVSLTVDDSYRNVEYLLSNGFIPADIRDSYQSIANEILQLLELNRPDQQRFQSISLHGDCHRGNVLWRDDRPHFVDFDDAISGPAIQDLWMMLSGDMNNQQIQLMEILEGYEMFMSFDLAQLSLIEPLRAMRVFHFNSWLARRWNDPAFPQCFPWFNSDRYWSEHILELKEVLTALQGPTLKMPTM